MERTLKNIAHRKSIKKYEGVLSMKRTLKNIKDIHISGRRWFQTTYGNTYHSVTVFITMKDNTEILMIDPFSYGYDNQYLNTALDLLKKYFQGFDQFPNLTTKSLREDLKGTYGVTDVRRKKDLHNQGKGSIYFSSNFHKIS